MVMRGRSLKEVQEIVGHGDFKMTLRYAHLTQVHLRSALEALDGLTPNMAHNMAQRPVNTAMSATSPSQPFEVASIGVVMERNG